MLGEGFEEIDVDTPAPSAPTKKSAKKPPKREPYEPVAIPKSLNGSLAELRTKIKAAGLGEHAKEIERLARPAIAFGLKKGKAPKNVVSRIGGDPDRPPRTAWPERNGVPLVFVAQIVLDRLDVGGALPKRGVLALYAQLDPNEDDYGEACVLEHYPDAKKLVRTTPPKSVERIGVGLLTPELRLTVPPSECSPIEDLDIDDPGAYHDGVFLPSIPDGPKHMLLGWPSAATNYGASHPFVMQIDSDDRIGFEMGDVETLRVFGTLEKPVCTMSEA